MENGENDMSKTNAKKMQIEYIRVDDLIPYEKNPRKNEAAVPKVAASIRSFGFRVPLVIDERNVIVAGHTRLLAVKHLMEAGTLPDGLQNGIPCIRATDLSPEQIRAFRLADNKVHEASSWDFGILDGELDAIGDLFDMSEFGFSLDGNTAPGDDFFKDANGGNDDDKPDVKTVICPHCGGTVEVKT